MANLRLVETDGDGRVVLPGHPDRLFLLRENEDGSILLQPATVATEAQHEFDATPELRELLAAATRCCHLDAHDSQDSPPPWVTRR